MPDRGRHGSMSSPPRPIKRRPTKLSEQDEIREDQSFSTKPAGGAYDKATPPLVEFRKAQLHGPKTDSSTFKELNTQKDLQRLKADTLEVALNAMTVDFQTSIALKKQNAFVVSIHSTFKRGWDIFILLIASFATFLKPMDAVFELSTSNAQWRYAQILLDVALLLDIMLSFRTSYLDDVTQEEIKNPARIRQHYATGWFSIDCLASIPVSFFDHHGSDILIYAQFAVFIKAWRAVHTPIATRVMARLSTVVHVGALRLIGLCTLYLVLHHYIACLFYLVVQKERDMDESEVWELPFKSNDSVLIKYIGSYFQAVTVTGGFTLYPRTNLERTFGGVMFVVGITINAWVFGTVAGLLQQINKLSDERGYRMECMNAHLREHRVAEVLERQIMDTHNSVASLEKAHNTEALFSGLPPKLHLELTSNVRRKFLNNVPFFRTLPPEVVMTLLQCMENVIVSNGDVIIREGEKGQAFYMIEAGTVEISHQDPRRGSYVSLKHLKEGDFFGEVSLIHNDVASATVTALSFCKLHVIYKETFDIIMNRNEAFKALLEKERSARLATSKQALRNRPPAVPKIDRSLLWRTRLSNINSHRRAKPKMSEQLSQMEGKLLQRQGSSRRNSSFKHSSFVDVGHLPTSMAVRAVCHMSHFTSKRLAEAQKISEEMIRLVDD